MSKCVATDKVDWLWVTFNVFVLGVVFALLSLFFELITFKVVDKVPSEVVMKINDERLVVNRNGDLVTVSVSPVVYQLIKVGDKITVGKAKGCIYGLPKGHTVTTKD